MKKFLTHWLISSVALALTAWLLPGVSIGSAAALLVGAIVLGFLNAVLKPVLVFLTLPLTVVTLGFFYFVLNAVVFLFGAFLVPGFDVHGFWWGFLGAIVMGLLSSIIGGVVRAGSGSPSRR